MNAGKMHAKKGDRSVTEKELRKLNRYQLLELLMIQTQRVEELEKALEEARMEKEQQRLSLSRLGSMAEVSLKVSGLLDAAQKAADLYVEAAKDQATRIEAEAREKAEAVLHGKRKRRNKK